MRNYTVKASAKISNKLIALLLAGALAFSTSTIVLQGKSSNLSLGNSTIESADSSPLLGISLGASATNEQTELQDTAPTLGISAFSNTRSEVVTTFAGLEAALAAKLPNITLAGDIVMLKQLRITSSVIIDGNGHTISEGARYNFMVNQENINIEIRNMSITGYNFYGFITTQGSSLGKNTIVTYNNVNYNGPQLAFLILNNTLRLIDSQIILENKVGSDAAQELAEVAFIEIGGTTLVHKTVGGDAFIWFVGSTTNAGGLTILDNADVTLQNDTTYFNYNNVSLGVDMVVNENAVLKMTMQTGMNIDTNHILRNLTIKKGASVQMQANNTGRPLVIKNSLVIEEGSTFIVTNRISSSTNVLHLSTTNTNVTINNPKLVYIKGRTAGYSPNIDLTGNVFNTFYNTTVDNSGYPSNVAAGNNGIANGHSTAYPEEFVTITSKTNPMNYFNNNANNGFLIGQFDMSSIISTPPTAYDTALTISMPHQSEAKMTFTPRGTTVSKSVSGVANNSNVVTLNSGIPIDENGYGPFVAGEEIQLVLRDKIADTTSFLHVNGAVKVIHTGELVFENIPSLEFGTQTMASTTMLYPLTQDAVLSVKDDRATASDWKVSVTATPFTELNSAKTLDPDALGFMDNGVFLSLKDSKIVWESTTNLTQPLQSKPWEKGAVGDGFILQIHPFQSAAASYSATLTWSLEATP